MTITQILTTPIAELLALPGWSRRAILSRVRLKKTESTAILMTLSDTPANRAVVHNLQEDISKLSEIESHLAENEDQRRYSGGQGLVMQDLALNS